MAGVHQDMITIGQIRAARSGQRAATRSAVWLCGCLLIAGAAWFGTARARAAEASDGLTAPIPITDLVQIFGLSTEEKARTHLLRIEGRVSYNDPAFRMLWLETNDVGTYLLLGPKAPSVRTGQQVVIEGKITPKDGLNADEVTVRVVAEEASVTPLQSKGRINDVETLHARIVAVEGYVDSQQYVDAEHVRMILVVENRPVICWVRPDDPAHVPNWQGRFVRATGLYSRRFDPTQTSVGIELWIGRQKDFQVIDTLQNSAKFHRTATPIDALYHLPPGTEVLVRGRIEKHEVGKVMTVRDATGQVEIFSIQQQRFPLGTEIAAVGHVHLSSGKWVIDEAFYRAVRPGASVDLALPASAAGLLQTVAQIRALGAEETAQGKPVEIVGMVTWVLPESPFLYLEDLTGGIRVNFDAAKMGTIRYGKYLRIKGVTRSGPVAPAVDLRDLTDLGSMSHPPAKPITLEQALTGKEEGEWVELRGFIQSTVSEGDWRRIHVTTPAGDFTGLLQNPVAFVANPGSLIRVHGVCEAILDHDQHIQGINLRVPFIHDITIEEDAPVDYYALPRHSLGDLAPLSASQDMLRVRVTGTVQHAVAGRLVYLTEEQKGVLLLTSSTQPLQAGDQIEAVGILGREGARAVLREAVYRKTGSGTVPDPLAIADVKQIAPKADSRLARMRGILIDSVVFDHLGQTRLTLQEGSTLFEAIYEPRAGSIPLKLDLGTGLELTGIYQLKFDDAHQARGFQLQLRSPEDVVVYMKPRLWTLQRAMIVVGFLAGCVLAGLTWITLLRRRVQEQTTQLRTQMEHQARLEAEVQRAARLESLGVLAGGIAHDYNNLLTIIMGNLSLMKFTPEVMSLEGARVDDIEAAAIRARDLTRQLLTFAAGGEPLRTAVDLPRVVRDAAEPVLRGSNIHCVHDVGSGLWPVYVDGDQITQVIQNLVRNANEVMGGEGSLRIILSNAEIRPGFHPKLKSGRYVRAVIIDTGKGIAPEVLPRIFDPYFTTKQSGGGLGLATAYSIVTKHQGHIEAQSRPGQGASFTLWLPAAEEPVPDHQIELPISVQEVAAPVKTPAAAARLAEVESPLPLRVLLMDDEESILKLGTILLQRMGLDTTAVADGASAVREFEAARRTSRPFSLLVLDLTIAGGMGGKEAIEQIRKIDPTVPAIVSSGYSRDPVMAQYQAYGFQAVIPKPYDIKRFKETVRKLLPTDLQVA